MVGSFDWFLEREDGAVTVDWVVLTSVIVGFGTVVVLTISGAVLDQSTGVSDYIAKMESGYQSNR